MILAIDIGGTKISTGLVDATGRVTHRHEVPTLADNADNIVQRALTAAHQTLQLYKPSNSNSNSNSNLLSIGIATGGDVDVAQGRIAYATPLLPGWAGLGLREIFEREFQLETRVDNDGNCSALAEAVFGAAQGCSHALTLIVGTGIGAGFVVQRNGVHEVMRGAFGGALNPGQIWLDEHTTYENVIASGALAKRYGQPIQHIAAALSPQDQLPTALQEAAQHLGQLAATCAAILDPNCIVIAGSILLLGERFLHIAQESFWHYARPPHRQLVLRPSTLSADSALVGASLL